MVCVSDQVGCPAGLHEIKSYTSSVDQDDARDQCSNFQTVLIKFKFKKLFYLLNPNSKGYIHRMVGLCTCRRQWKDLQASINWMYEQRRNNNCNFLAISLLFFLHIYTHFCLCQTSVSLDTCVNGKFHLCGLWDPLLNPIYDGGAARAAGSCQQSDASCGDKIEVLLQLEIK